MNPPMETVKSNLYSDLRRPSSSEGHSINDQFNRCPKTWLLEVMCALPFFTRTFLSRSNYGFLRPEQHPAAELRAPAVEHAFKRAISTFRIHYSGAFIPYSTHTCEPLFKLEAQARAAEKGRTRKCWHCAGRRKQTRTSPVANVFLGKPICGSRLASLHCGLEILSGIGRVVTAIGKNGHETLSGG